jgi:hypothetical protein
MRRGLRSGSNRVLGRFAGECGYELQAVAVSRRKRDGTIDGRIQPLS